VNVPFWQGMPVMITRVEFPGESCPFTWEKLTPFRLLLAVQFTSCWDVAVSLTATAHW